MTNISAAQEKIISDYASSCMAEIATCYSKQVTQINAWSSNANINNVYSVLKGACRNVALTCSYAVFSADQSAAGCPPDDTNTCIENISDIFYQSMLCPDYSFWVPNESAIAQLGTIYNGTNIYVNERCVCQAGYGVNLGRCEQCPTGTNFDTSCTAASGACAMMGCKCPTGQTWSGSACITPTPL
jgi:hypothetical protein